MKYKNKSSTKLIGIIILFLSFTLFTNLTTLHPQNPKPQKRTEILIKKNEPPKSFTVECKSLCKVNSVQLVQHFNIESFIKKNTIRVVAPGMRTFKIEPFAIPWEFPKSETQRESKKSHELPYPIDYFDKEKNCESRFIYRLRITSSELDNWSNLAFEDFELPDGAKLWIYNEECTYVEGPYMKKDISVIEIDKKEPLNNEKKIIKELWTPVIPGGRVVVEILCPNKEAQNEIKIGKLTMFSSGKEIFPNSKGIRKDGRGLCNIDVACPEAEKWRNQIRSVAMFTFKGIYRFSGVLLNNTSWDCEPYFLTCAHSGVSEENAHTMVFYWNFENRNCISCTCNRLYGKLSDNQIGAEFLASWTLDEGGTDFALVKLKNIPAREFNVYYSGWDATGEPLSEAVGIHHPRGLEKAICLSGEWIASIVYDSTDASKTNYWEVDKWSRGTTQSGSSGSGLWDARYGRLVGQLTGSFSNCSKMQACAPNGLYSWYGKFSVSWFGDRKGKQLKKWLDPKMKGEFCLRGLDPLCKEEYAPKK